MSVTDNPSQRSTGSAKPGADKSSFTHEAARKAADMAEGAADSADAAMEKGKQLAEVASVQAKEATDMLIERIKQNPMSAVGIAFGAGILFAILRK